MEKKSYALSPHAKPTKQNKKDTLKISKPLRKQLSKLSENPDNHIDYSDIPELDFAQLGTPVMGKFYRPVKKAISIRMDADVLAWLKSQSDKYQQLINHICRQYYLSHKKV